MVVLFRSSKVLSIGITGCVMPNVPDLELSIVQLKGVYVVYT